MQALAHLGAAMVHQHRAVRVDVHQRAGLVVEDRIEGDAEFHRREGEPALDGLIRRVVARDRLAPRAVIAARLELRGDARHRVVLDGHAVMRDVALGDAVEIQPPDVQRVQAARAGDVVQHGLDDHHALGRAEAAERRIGHGVGLAAMRNELQVLEEIRVVDVAHRPIVHGGGQVERITAA